PVVEKGSNHVVSMTKVAAARDDAATEKMRWLGAIGRCCLSFASPIPFRVSGPRNPERFLKIFRCFGIGALPGSSRPVDSTKQRLARNVMTYQNWQMRRMRTNSIKKPLPASMGSG
ncbi:hypothetical protein, partial [Mesorhizobium sp.]|uniref:hypothetical protein n=2 Tax=Mesorhizobium TaxID=68287 RepID=UPI0025E14509